MDKLYSHNVKSYAAELMKLCADVSGGDDIMASLPDPKRFGAFPVPSTSSLSLQALLPPVLLCVSLYFSLSSL